MAGNRLILVTGVTRLAGGMTVCETVFMTGRTTPSIIMTVTVGGRIMLTAFCVTYVADAVVRSGEFCIAGTGAVICENNIGSGDRLAECSVSTGSDFILDHVEVVVAVWIVTVPAELSTFPYWINYFKTFST